MSKQIIDQMGQQMDKAIQGLQKDLTKLRTGRATPAVLEGINVDFYGTPTPIAQTANVTTPDARTIQIVPYDQSSLAALERAIFEANIGLTPQNDGKLIRINMPPLTEDRRKEMGKGVKKTGEESKVAIRNCRRDANEEIKKLEKGKTVSEDEAKKLMEQIQKKTDEKVAEVDKLIVTKEKEIMTL